MLISVVNLLGAIGVSNDLEYILIFWPILGRLRLDVNVLLINSNDVVFAACDTGGFFRSVNNGDTWTCYRFRFLEIDPPGNEYTYFVKKVASQHTYDYNTTTIPFIDGFPFWIDTVGLLISEFITIFDDQYQITEQLQITVPFGTFTVYKAVEDDPIYSNIYYYDVDTGFLVKAEYDYYGFDSVLLNITIIVISEFPVFALPILLIAIPLTIKYSKIFKNKN